MTLLPLIEKVDSFPYVEDPFYWKFYSHDGVLLGYIVPEIADRLKGSIHFQSDDSRQLVQLHSSLDTFEKRNEVLAEIALEWKQTDELLAKGWRDELYTIYNPRSVPYMLMERAFSCLLGVATYGVHINGYVPPSKTKDKVLKMWVPRRSLTKATYPGKLDNTIAGGLAHPHGIWENVVKECYEEGGLSAEFVESHIKSAGVVSYLCQPYGAKGHAQPEVEYTYDLEFDSETGTVPFPVDGEAEDFQLMSIDEVKNRMLADEFKPNCGLVIVDFLMRHGYITSENEPNYLEIQTRIHRRFPFPMRN